MALHSGAPVARDTVPDGTKDPTLMYGVFGRSIMKFTLHYDGPLPSSGNKAQIEAKWGIRRILHPQFVDLWRNHPALRQVEDNRHFPKRGGATIVQVHHLYPGPARIPLMGDIDEEGMTFDLEEQGPHEIIDLCEPIEKHGAWFRPLVRTLTHCIVV